MAIDDWCDVAWAYVLRNTPMMANPSEYREALWTVLHDGDTPPPPRTETTDSSGKRRRARSSRGMTKRDKANLDAFVGQIAQLQAAKKAD
jgi:hypothetical protein